MPQCLSGTAEEDCQHPLLTSAALQLWPVFSAGTCVVCMWASRVPTHRGESRLSARGVAVPQSQSGKALEGVHWSEQTSSLNPPNQGFQCNNAACRTARLSRFGWSPSLGKNKKIPLEFIKSSTVSIKSLAPFIFARGQIIRS